MGWIRTHFSSPPAKQLHSLAARVEVDSVKANDADPVTPAAQEKRADARVRAGRDDAQTACNSSNHSSYPVQPKSKADDSLPFIPADEVKKQDGKDGRRLCMSLACAL